MSDDKEEWKAALEEALLALGVAALIFILMILAFILIA